MQVNMIQSLYGMSTVLMEVSIIPIQYGIAYSSYSPFNSYASYPPVIVDEEGNFYGYFTVNKYKSKRANFDLVNIICEYYESIREDVDEWYDKIF